MSERNYDIAVVGSGFAGSLLAMICHRLGRSVILIEKGKHPRFAIGESSTPLTNLLLEELSTRYDLPALTPFAKWGTWQETYPQIACGLKRGFTFYHHTLGEPDAYDPDRRNELLVAASPHDRIADTHWYRPKFDQFFANEAHKLGIEYLDETEISGLEETEQGWRLEPLGVQAKFVVDATGPRGFLQRALKLPEVSLPGFPETQALYSHFLGVGRYGNGQKEEPPYPVDDAAVHHVFDGGWIWVLQFNNGVTSAGVAATHETAERLKLSEGAEAWERLLETIPRLRDQFAQAKPIRAFVHAPRLSFRSGTVSGRRWVQLPSAAGFVDPLLSTGFAMTLLGVSRLAEIVENDWESAEFSAKVQAAADKSDAELLATGRLLGALYASMNNFRAFTAFSLLYFTAVIYSETVRRLGKPELAPSFLLHDDAYFGPKCLELFSQLGTTDLSADIIRAIEPMNLAGLGAPERRNWYPADARDLFESAHKVGASAQEISALLERAGFRASK